MLDTLCVPTHGRVSTHACGRDETALRAVPRTAPGTRHALVPSLPATPGDCEAPVATRNAHRSERDDAIRGFAFSAGVSAKHHQGHPKPPKDIPGRWYHLLTALWQCGPCCLGAGRARGGRGRRLRLPLAPARHSHLSLPHSHPRGLPIPAASTGHLERGNQAHHTV